MEWLQSHFSATCAWAESASEKLASVKYLVGSWTCAHSVGSFSGTYKTSYAKTLVGAWLRQAYEFPPKQFGSNAQPVNAEFLIGYDPRERCAGDRTSRVQKGVTHRSRDAPGVRHRQSDWAARGVAAGDSTNVRSHFVLTKESSNSTSLLLSR